MIDEARVRAALPPSGFLRDYVDYAGACTDAPLLYHIAGGFSLLAQAAPTNLSVDFGDQIFSNCFFLVVGPSTRSRKSVSIRIARRILKESMPDNIGETPGSPEALVDGMRQRNKQVLFYEEFGQFLAETDQNYRTPIKTVLNSLWDCSEIGRALVKSRKGSLENPRLSIHAGCDARYLERHTERVDWEAGFLARWIVFATERQRYYKLPKPNPTLRANLATRLKAINDAAPVAAECAGFEPQAETTWAAWLAKCEKIAEEQDSLGAAAVHRAPPNALKMAMLLALDRKSIATGWRISLNELIPAITFANFHIESVETIVAQLAPSPMMLDRRTVLRAVDPVPTPLGVITRRAKMLKKFVLPVLETLVAEGEVEPAPFDPNIGQPRWRLTSREELARRATAAKSIATAQEMVPEGVGTELPAVPQEHAQSEEQLSGHEKRAREQANGVGPANAASTPKPKPAPIAEPDPTIDDVEDDAFDRALDRMEGSDDDDY